MKDQVTIQSRGATNADGQLSGSWSDLVTLFARVEQLGGKEIVNGIQFAAEISARITTPYYPGIEPRMRVLYVDSESRTHRYDILFVSDVEQRSTFLEILAQEIFSTT